VVSKVGADPFAPGAVTSRAGSFSARRLLSSLSRSVVARRLLLAVPLLFIVSALTFLLLALTGGDPAVTILGLHGTPQQYAQLRHQLGLDRPVYVQYWEWLRHAIRGNLGNSLFFGQTVKAMITERLPVTLSLMGGSLLLMFGLGVALGVFSAVRGGASGRLVDALSLAGFALPAIWIGAILIEVFAVKIGWFPAVGYVPLTQSFDQWFRSLILPVVTLSIGGICVVMKNTREAMLDVLASEHIRMARANGIPERSVIFVLALRNVAIRVVTLLGLTVIGLLGGTVIVETIFAMPGVGGLLVNAVNQHDLPVVQGIALAFMVIVVVVNLATDLVYSLLDPRVRLR
jgi:peptide/nickel transport system permease protein